MQQYHTGLTALPLKMIPCHFKFLFIALLMYLPIEISRKIAYKSTWFILYRWSLCFQELARRFTPVSSPGRTLKPHVLALRDQEQFTASASCFQCCRETTAALASQGWESTSRTLLPCHCHLPSSRLRRGHDSQMMITSPDCPWPHPSTEVLYKLLLTRTCW